MRKRLVESPSFEGVVGRRCANLRGGEDGGEISSDDEDGSSYGGGLGRGGGTMESRL